MNVRVVGMDMGGMVILLGFHHGVSVGDPLCMPSSSSCCCFANWAQANPWPIVANDIKSIMSPNPKSELSVGQYPSILLHIVVIIQL